MNKGIFQKVIITGLVTYGLFSPQHAYATAIADVTEISQYNQIYQLDIPVFSNYKGATPAYNIDNSASIFSSGIQRIAYYLELEFANQREWVWVSMNAFTQDLALIGVPTNSFWQQTLSNMNIESNVSSITTGTNIATGNIEFWNTCYAPQLGLGGIGGDAANYDFNDNTTNSNCYGSMQVHNYAAQQTLFAWNNWDDSNTSLNNDIGIGNQTNGHTDWTFAYNAGDYTLRRLEVWVDAGSSVSVPTPTITWLLGVGLAGLLGRRKKFL